MRHTFSVVTVKKLLNSVYIYGSYRKINTMFTFWTTLYLDLILGHGLDYGIWIKSEFHCNLQGMERSGLGDKLVNDPSDMSIQ